MQIDSVQANPITIGFFGEAMLEIGGEPLKKSYGGDTLNTATYLSRLNRLDKKPHSSKKSNLYINYITAMGTDNISKQLLAQWQEEGLNTQWVVTTPNKKVGLYIIENTDDGDRLFHYWRDDSAAKYYFQHSRTPLEHALIEQSLDIIYISGSSLAILNSSHREYFVQLLQNFREAGGKIFFDNNYRHQLWSTEDARECYFKILRLADTVFLTDTDEEQVFGSGDPDKIIQRCKELGVREVVIKRGVKPTVVFTNEYISIPVNNVAHVVDCCAAGDSFAAGYIFERLRGGSPERSAMTGNKLAGQVIQYPGAIIPIQAMGNDES